jgi:hypothetical protein
MVLEAQRDNANRAGRLAVTAYLAKHYDVNGGEVIMLSMDRWRTTSTIVLYGFRVRNFLHEGKWRLWASRSSRVRMGSRTGCSSKRRSARRDALYLRGKDTRGSIAVSSGSRRGRVALYRINRFIRGFMVHRFMVQVSYVHEVLRTS